MSLFSWHRKRQLSVRRLCRADQAGLRWLSAGGRGRARLVEQWPGHRKRRRLVQSFGAGQLGVERGSRLIGALLCAPAGEPGHSVCQPWDRRHGPTGWSDRQAHDQPPTAERWVRGCGGCWPQDLTADETAELLTRARLALAQQLGWRGTFSVVEPAGWPRWRGQLDPAAYVQQLHARSLDDRRLNGYLQAGYVPRGFWTDAAALGVVMVWYNRDLV